MFAHLSVLENVRVALQRKLGTSFHFWKRESSLSVLDDRGAGAAARRSTSSAYAALPAVELSYGRKRALEIATTLAMEPTLMLLDEPTQGMGLEDVERVRELIRKVAANRTVLMVEHNMSVVASIADTITVLARGAIAGRGALRRGLAESRGASRPTWAPPTPSSPGATDLAVPSSRSADCTAGTASRTCCTAST